MAKTIDYYMACPSPWSYLGHQRLLDIAQRHGAIINLKPVDYGRIFPVSGGLPLPKRAPQRQAYRLVELARWRDFLGVRLNTQPKFFPVDATPSSLMVCAALANPDQALALAGAIMRACWADDRNIADPDTLKSIADECKLDGAALAAASAAAATRAIYDRFTQDAIDLHVFGAPTYVFAGELFWGQDRLDFLNRALANAA
jgi:2-hydroxychromene-2-carboxylate isomerase